MTPERRSFSLGATAYLQNLHGCFSPPLLEQIGALAEALRQVWIEGRQVFICGNGGSAANALHLANDLHYGIGACGPGPTLPGLRVEALTANPAVISCLANDTGYDNIFAHQLEVKARAGDVLLVLSGSGNSANVVRALEVARRLGVTSYAILAYTGGQCLALADQALHVPIHDMQIAEDSQLIVGHLCMQWLNQHKPSVLPGED